jgi:hypothetical protein
VHQLTHSGLGSRIQAWSLTARVRLGCDFTSGTVAAQELLDKGKANAKKVGDCTLRAKLALVGV